MTRWAKGNRIHWETRWPLTMALLEAWLLGTLACATPRLTEPPITATPFCFRVRLSNGDTGLGCSGRRSTCEHARANAVSLAGLAGIEEVGECGLERPQP